MEYLITSAVSAKQAFNKVVKPNPVYKLVKRYYIVECLEDAELAEAKSIAFDFVNNPQTINQHFKLRRNTVGCIVLKSSQPDVDDDYMFFKLKETTYV